MRKPARKREVMATIGPNGLVPAPGWRFKPGSRNEFERDETSVQVAEPLSDGWWRRPYAGTDPPSGKRPGRPWFRPEPDVWVDENGWRWPLSALPRGAELPERPSGDEPLDALESELRIIQRTYIAGHDIE